VNTAHRIARIAVAAAMAMTVQLGVQATAGAATMVEDVPTSTVASPQPLRATATPYCVVDLASSETACYQTEDEALGSCGYLHVTVYDGLNFTTAAPRYHYCGNLPCLTGVSYVEPRLDYYWEGTNYGVNNRISSVETFNNCRVKFYDYYDPSRPDNSSSAWIVRDGNLAEWSNRASSFVVTAR
jgi:hypothetical protein